MTRDFGRVGHIKVHDTDAVFMVVSESGVPEIRAGIADYRMVINLSGVGYMGSRRINPGDMGAVKIVTEDIEWLDD